MRSSSDSGSDSSGTAERSLISRSPSRSPFPRRSPPQGISTDRRQTPQRSSRNRLAFPAFADDPQPPLAGGQRQAQPRGDLLVGVAFHLPHRDGTQFVVAQLVEQAL